MLFAVLKYCVFNICMYTLKEDITKNIKNSKIPIGGLYIIHNFRN